MDSDMIPQPATRIMITMKTMTNLSLAPRLVRDEVMALLDEISVVYKNFEKTRRRLTYQKNSH